MYDAPMTDDTLEILATGRFMQMVRQGRWEYVRRHTAEGAVAVIATTRDNELVLVEQWRVPMGVSCLELPAGLVGDSEADKGEALAVAAHRELLEEAGYTASSMRHLCTIATSPGLSNEKIDLYRATGLDRQHAGGGVDHESITVHLVRLNELDRWLSRRASGGAVIDVKVYLAAALLQHEQDDMAASTDQAQRV